MDLSSGMASAQAGGADLNEQLLSGRGQAEELRQKRGQKDHWIIALGPIFGPYGGGRRDAGRLTRNCPPDAAAASFLLWRFISCIPASFV